MNIYGCKMRRHPNWIPCHIASPRGLMPDASLHNCTMNHWIPLSIVNTTASQYGNHFIASWTWNDGEKYTEWRVLVGGTPILVIMSYQLKHPHRLPMLSIIHLYEWRWYIVPVDPINPFHDWLILQIAGNEQKVIRHRRQIHHLNLFR